MQLSSSLSAAALLSLLLFTSQIAAQDQPNNLPNLSSITSADSTTGDSSQASTTASAQSSEATKSSQNSAKTTRTDTSNTNSGSAPTSLPDISSTTATSGAAPTSLPGLSTNAAYDGPTNLPTLAGAYNYPAPTVPPTKLAPFMQKSNLPSGTVFIAVGAVLGFLGFIVLAWRGLVAWSLHRSVRRDNTFGTLGKQRSGPHKSLFKTSGAPFYAHGMGSNLSLDPLNPSGKSGVKSQTPRQSLFFSPTAGAGMHTAGNRNSSTYLPAGYYAAGNAAPAGGAGMTHVGGGNRLSHMSIADIGPKSQGYQRAQSMEPGSDSNSLHPSRGTENVPGDRLSYGGRPSMSSGNLSLPPQGRAPSAYLEELFENYPPGAIPHE